MKTGAGLDYGKWNPYSLLVGVSNGSIIIQLMQKFLKNLEIHLLYDPVILLLTIYPKDSTSYFRDTNSTVLIAAPLSVAMKWKSLDVNKCMDG